MSDSFSGNTNAPGSVESGAFFWNADGADNKTDYTDFWNAD